MCDPIRDVIIYCASGFAMGKLSVCDETVNKT